jgi:hypothetical protein
VSTATARRSVDALARGCYLGIDAVALRDEVLRGLSRIIPIDAVSFANVDPPTVYCTSVMTDEPLRGCGRCFWTTSSVVTTSRVHRARRRYGPSTFRPGHVQRSQEEPSVCAIT